MTLTPSPGINLGHIFGALILAAGLICTGWAVVEHIRTWQRRRTRLARKAAKAATRAATPGLTEVHAFAQIAHRNHALDAWLDDLADHYLARMQEPDIAAREGEGETQ